MVIAPASVFVRAPWWAAILGGVVLGPLSLMAVFGVIFAMQGQLRSFSMAHLEMSWVYCVIASSSAVCVYVALLKRRAS